MPKRLPKTQQLSVFQAVVHLHSINAAAKALNMSQPSVTRIIKDLEDCLGTQLIVRSSQGITLTPAGKSFATNTSFFLENLSRAMDEAVNLYGKTNARVRFGCSPISTGSIVIPAIRQLMCEFPESSCHVDDNPLGRNMKHIRDGFLDFAIGNANADASFSDFEQEALFECPFYVCCRRGHPLEKATKLEDLLGGSWWITGQHRVTETKYPIFTDFKAKRSFSTRSFMVGYPMITENNYLALLSSIQIRNHADKLSVIPIKDFESVGRYVLIYLKSVPMTHIARRLITLLHSYADEYPWELNHKETVKPYVS